ncbi:nuclear transport factor 2 family protein [Xylophilus sp. GOD-11R]|uniref:nuclear transport factor 2 family protein n=1 Tax=Xylophilus sp. GOD-11R TaxID=3089814 RepID=UPI00298C8B9D|nr:nuclear transport factor 2 family protein [Xylophilus sp. GOD-11R]WPB58977.1 nuclear transport factor 2 family protein [Xylophilus sp. GOD-11R]
MMRRHLVVPAIALAALSTLPALPAFAAGEQDAVARKVEAFRQAQIAGTPEALSPLVSPDLSYSHSDGRVEDRATFIANATTGKSPFTALQYENPVIAVVGDSAVVRFHWMGEQKIVADGRMVPTNLHILMVWQKQGDDWKLLARSATKL